MDTHNTDYSQLKICNKKACNIGRPFQGVRDNCESRFGLKRLKRRSLGYPNFDDSVWSEIIFIESLGLTKVNGLDVILSETGDLRYFLGHVGGSFL